MPFSCISFHCIQRRNVKQENNNNCREKRKHNGSVKQLFKLSATRFPFTQMYDLLAATIRDARLLTKYVIWDDWLQAIGYIFEPIPCQSQHSMSTHSSMHWSCAGILVFEFYSGWQNTLIWLTISVYGEELLSFWSSQHVPVDLLQIYRAYVVHSPFRFYILTTGLNDRFECLSLGIYLTRKTVI